MTTVFPLTTSTALTSVFTGLSPAQHQIIGYHMYSKKYGLIYNTLDMKQVYGYNAKVELAKDYIQNLQLLLPIIEQDGVRTSIITKAKILGSGLSQITHRDTKLIPYYLSSDMWTHTITTLMGPDPCLSIVYYSGVDNLAHKYGAYSKETTFEVTTIEHSLREFINNIPKQTREETLLIIVSDHGISEAKQPLYLKDILS
jgi:predicted AlkP superfamily pyrophosphatase or phosphodiesterase